ncbi:sensor histidine kinase [Flavobacteriaceae bacterium F08102]|nr:sensor histidine kinase [Flavobacteriaceae bacterium F08102]
MNSTKRFVFQAIFWFVIWVMLWLQQGTESNFIGENLPVYLAQVALVGMLIYYTGPRFLFTKKYVQFAVISLLVIGMYGFITFLLRDHKAPPPLGLAKIPKRPPSIVFMHSLFILISYILGMVIEFAVFTKRKEDEIKLRKTEHIQTELKLLKSQINPHFIFNSLNNIYALSAIDAQKTQESISHLSTMLRYVLYECERPLVPLQKEVDYIEHYLKLFSLKSSKPYAIKTAYEGIHTSLEIAPMLLIPFVENALKHSHIEKRKDTFIDIRLSTDDKTIHFQCKNSIADSCIEKDAVGGIGLENVKKRLAILYPDKHSLLCEAQGATFVVNLNIQTQ